MPLMPNALLRLKYEEWAEEYLKSLPLEHFMEATAQSVQREITVESLALVRPKRPDFQYFSELLIQYPKRGKSRPGRVVPDTMVVVHPEPIKATGSYDMPFQPVGPYWTLEYVSKGNKRKDYEANYRIYERDLKVPYYLVFYPDPQELSLFRLGNRKYVSVPENQLGRHAIPELEIEVAVQEGWVRYWFRGELLALPAEREAVLTDTLHRLQQEKQRADELQRQVAELTRRIAELEGKAGNGKKRK